MDLTSDDVHRCQLDQSRYATWRSPTPVNFEEPTFAALAFEIGEPAPDLHRRPPRLRRLPITVRFDTLGQPHVAIRA
jgi:hypothetical protein